MTASTGERWIDIACAADRRFELPTIVLIYSIIRNSASSHQLRIHVFDGGLSAECRALLSRMAAAAGTAIHFVRPREELLDGVRITRRFPIATWFRLLIPDMLPASLSRVIYLDTDILVNTRIEPLWHVELNECYLGARLSTLEVIANSRISESDELRDRSASPYFNAGVMLLNLVALRAEGVRERALEFARRYPQLTVWCDQDALNAVAVDRWCPLQERWNSLVKDIRDSPFVLDPNSVLHFLGPHKPWMKDGYRGSETTDIGAAHRIYATYIAEVRSKLPDINSGVWKNAARQLK
jgi:lipopolysaccharide biosynthesis glycosyltransferase